MLAAAGAFAQAYAGPAPAPAASPPAPPPAATGPRLAISLPEAVFLALRDNRTIQSAYVERVAQKYDLFVAKTRFWPTATLAASVEATRQDHLAGSSFSLEPTATWLLPTGAQFQFAWSKLQIRGAGGTVHLDIASVTATQPLLKGAGLAVNEAPIRIAELGEKINQLDLASTVINTVTAVILDYRALLDAQAELAIAQDSLARARSQLQTGQALVDAGRMAAADLLQTQADIANEQVGLLSAQQGLRHAQINLLQALAMDLHTNIVASDSLAAPHVDIDLDKAVAIALSNRPDYLSQERSLEQARQTLLVAKNNRLWSLNLVGSLERQTGGGPLAINPTTGLPIPGSGFSGTNSSIGLQLSIPLGDFTLQQAEVQAATSVRTDELALADLRQEVEAEVRDAVEGVEASWARLEAAHQARDLAARTLQTERQKMQVGRASNFEVLSFQAELRAADTQALAAAIDYLDALTTLDQQVGTTLDTWKISLNP
ncbi:MAG TPA: TolC family protein [Caulobacteraceae bacterium]|nr:TolC family protein [Caulobacteraceae bacterium]